MKPFEFHYPAILNIYKTYKLRELYDSMDCTQKAIIIVELILQSYVLTTREYKNCYVGSLLKSRYCWINEFEIVCCFIGQLNCKKGS